MCWYFGRLSFHHDIVHHTHTRTHTRIRSIHLYSYLISYFHCYSCYSPTSPHLSLPNEKTHWFYILLFKYNGISTRKISQQYVICSIILMKWIFVCSFTCRHFYCYFCFPPSHTQMLIAHSISYSGFVLLLDCYSVIQTTNGK